MRTALVKISVPILVVAGAIGASAPFASSSAQPTDEVDDYYADAEGLTGQELKDALHGIIADSTALTYDEVWDALRETDEDPADPESVVLLYTGRSQGENTNGGGAGEWNREHVWPKSHGDFGTEPGPGTDVHHLRPTDVAVNAERGNKDFDIGGAPVDGAPGNLTDDDSWEPRDEVKGDVARMVFYMAVRYEGGGGFADLEVNDQVDNGSSPFTGRSSVLVDWHVQDPPDEAERHRNQVIFDDWQHNRNPFIDHPEWVGEIWN